MIKERYCSFEVSKLLREKGFDEQCRAAYTNYGKLFTTQIQQYVTNIVWECVAPTHQMAIDFLREAYGIFIEIERDNQYYQGREVVPMSKHDIERGHTPEYYATIYDAKSKTYVTEHFNDYAECVDSAIKYGLTELI